MANQVSSTNDMEIYFDIEGKKINGSTLPADIVTSLSRPDIVIINRAASPVEVYLYKLTKPTGMPVSRQTSSPTGSNAPLPVSRLASAAT